MSTNMTFGVETSTHRPKYRLWLGLYIITIQNMSDVFFRSCRDIIENTDKTRNTRHTTTPALEKNHTPFSI